MADGRNLGGGGSGVAVVRVKQDSIKNLRVGKQAEVVRDEGEKMINVGKVEVRLEEVERKQKMRKVEDNIKVGKDEGVESEARKVVLERKAAVKPFPRVRVEDRVEVTRAFDKCTTVPDAKSRFIPIYKSKLVDRQWAQSDMVASVLEGDSTLSLQ